jgi:hypothetical protein
MTSSHPVVTDRPPVSKPLQLRGRLANAHRRGDEATILEIRRDLAAAKLEQYIERVVSEAPPLTDEQRDRLAGLLNGAA